MAPCPCGRRAAYADCCGRWHAVLAAPDPESLMRSRYSAFVLEKADHLLATWHPGTRPPSIEFEPGVRWLGLEVRAHGPHWVEFVARSRAAGGRANRMHVRSRFVQEDGVWYYLDDDK